VAEVRLPDGFAAEPGSMDLLGEVGAFLRRISLIEVGRPGWTDDDLRVWWGGEDIEIERDLVAVRDSGGELVATSSCSTLRLT
jgi:hypothetical protein